MMLRIVLLCIVGFAIGVRSLGDSNYPLFNADDGLPSTDKLNKILSLSEQQLKRIEAVDYK